MPDSIGSNTGDFLYRSMKIEKNSRKEDLNKCRHHSIAHENNLNLSQKSREFPHNERKHIKTITHMESEKFLNNN